jgi:hypothetical protein
MHNIDRTNLESNYGEYTGEFERDGYEFEFEGNHGFETYGEYQGEYSGEYTGEYTGEYAMESPFSEAEEMELAAELLTISNEAELDQFLGKLIKKVSSGIGKVIKSPIGRALGGALKGVAKTALPMLGSAAGNFLLPGVGGAIGGKLASAAGQMFGLELEGLSQEDQEFEVARQVVRLAGTAANNAAQAAPSTPPQQVMQSAMTAAAQQHAPGLLSGAATQAQAGARPGARHNGRCAHKNTGRWIRRGKAIVILGA